MTTTHDIAAKAAEEMEECILVCDSLVSPAHLIYKSFNKESATAIIESAITRAIDEAIASANAERDKLIDDMNAFLLDIEIQPKDWPLYHKLTDRASALLKSPPPTDAVKTPPLPPGHHTEDTAEYFARLDKARKEQVEALPPGSAGSGATVAHGPGEPQTPKAGPVVCVDGVCYGEHSLRKLIQAHASAVAELEKANDANLAAARIIGINTRELAEALRERDEAWAELDGMTRSRNTWAELHKIESQHHATFARQAETAEADLTAARASLAEATRTRRWNIEKTDDGLRICEGEHERAHDCEWIEYVPKTAFSAKQRECEELAKQSSGRMDEIHATRKLLHEEQRHHGDLRFNHERLTAQLTAEQQAHEKLVTEYDSRLRSLREATQQLTAERALADRLAGVVANIDRMKSISQREEAQAAFEAHRAARGNAPTP